MVLRISSLMKKCIVFLFNYTLIVFQFQLNEITLHRESNMLDSPVNASIVCDEISPTSYSVSNPNSVTTDENGNHHLT